MKTDSPSSPLLLDLMSVAHAVWGAECITNRPFGLYKLARAATWAVMEASISITVVMHNYLNLNHRAAVLNWNSAYQYGRTKFSTNYCMERTKFSTKMYYSCTNTKFRATA